MNPDFNPQDSVLYPMASATLDCLRAYRDRGAVVPQAQSLQLSDGVKQLLSAAHHVLAGGAITVDIVQPGASEVVAELESSVRTAIAASNEINREAGVYMTFTV